MPRESLKASVPSLKASVPGLGYPANELAFYDCDQLLRRKQLRLAGQPNNRTDYTYEPDSNLDVLTKGEASVPGLGYPQRVQAISEEFDKG